MKNNEAFENFIDIIKKLRSPEGCPWDREQTPETLRSTFIEETYEAIDAINSGNIAHIREELGDTFLNVAMIAYMYEQSGDFTVAEVLNEVSEKLVRRHPHVFPESEGHAIVEDEAITSGEVLNQWDRIKEQIEGKKSEKGILDEVPMAFPPLLRAYKMQKKASKKGFDWDNSEGSFLKFHEEIDELKEAECTGNKMHMEEEAGDLLFAAVNVIRHMGIDPTIALAKANEKFKKRFTYVETECKAQGIEMKKENLEKMDNLWNKAKSIPNS